MRKRIVKRKVVEPRDRLVDIVALRDAFAMAALRLLVLGWKPGLSFDTIAETAYAMADAMIRARR